MVSKSGFPLLREDSVKELRRLMDIAEVITPNIPEAEILVGFPLTTEADMERAAYILAEEGAKNILIKGGHRLGTDAVDLLFTSGTVHTLRSARIPTRHTHGTGCTLSTAIASRLALGDGVEAAVRWAKDYLTQAIRDAYPAGKGVGPVGHLSALYRRAGMKAI
jgi:hydroxymethylpyrimidine/phosphomethylpyrimidine kinase